MSKLKEFDFWDEESGMQIKVIEKSSIMDLEAKLRNTRAELGLLKAKADKLAKAFKNYGCDNCDCEDKNKALKEYRGEK